MACGGLILAALLVSGHAGLASASIAYIVGDSEGWALDANYTRWARDKKLVVGDKLVFRYVSKAHTVTEVTEASYNNCFGSKPLSNDDSGLTTVPLNTDGAHYFICNVPGHCDRGMKLAVTVAAPSTGSSLLPGAMDAAVVAGALLILL